MKTLIIALILLLTGCGSISALTPGVTSEMYSKAEKACNGRVHMVTQTVGIDYDVYCTDGTRHQL